VNCRGCSGTGLDLGATPTTPTGGVKTNRDTVVESGDDDLVAYGDNDAELVLSKYLPFLGTRRRPADLAAAQRHARVGRVSYDGVIQQMPRAGDVRGCCVARPGLRPQLVRLRGARAVHAGAGDVLAVRSLADDGDHQRDGRPGALHTALAPAWRA